ncbi:unnamed protein product [Heterobilharzia americana]|nr:unnamed protein product [Heterobilharzia americana]CAH8620377.1 unnamed protein product [Heterobilharzia americana]
MEESFGTSNQTVSQSLNIDPNSSEQRRDHNATHSKDNVSISNTASSLHHHHRRKRSHVSPLTRSVHTINLLETASYMECGLPSLRDHVETIELTDEDNGLVGCNPDYLLRNEVSHIGEKSVDALKLTKLDPEFRDLISRYVCSEYVVHCLELAGFCSPYVVAQLDDHQLQRIEAFVGHACSIMKSAALREHFLGPIFANDPLKFKLPSGAACGILLAASEIRRRYRRTQISSDSQNVMDEDVIVVPDSCDQSFNDVACQTDSSVSHSVSLTSPEPVILGETNSVFAGNHDSKSPMPAVSSSSKVSISDSPNSSLKLEATTVSSTESAVMMAAALQVAAAAVSGNGYNSISLFSNPTSNDNNSTFSGLNNSFPADTNSVPHPGTSTSPISSRATVPVANTSAATVAPNAPSSQPSFVPSSSPVSCGSGLYENEVINLERLKQHSSASAIRLASRQFVNAYLMRGRDFDMEMELSVTPEGLKRVTGIFYCHLCREKRERTSAVRFQ